VHQPHAAATLESGTTCRAQTEDREQKICRHPLIFARQMRPRRNVGPPSYVACMHRVVVLEGTDELGVAEVHAVCGHIYSVRMLDMFRTHIVERPAMEPARSRFLWH
jgi:hypothetical protein